MKVILCAHMNGTVADRKQMVPDYHPLNKEEIATLLEEAASASGVLRSQIQERLCQGIPGYTCPRTSDKHVLEKETEIGELYLKNYHKGRDPETVEELYQIMVR